MWPIAIALAALGFIIGKSKSIVTTNTVQREQVSGPRVTFLPPAPIRREPMPLDILRHHIRRGIAPSERLVAAACQQAYAMGNYPLVDAIVAAFEKQCGTMTPASPASEAPASPPAASPADAPASTGTGGVPPAPEPRSYRSPIEGVEDGDWANFAEAMKIHAPDFETDRHLGAFHQRKDRLAKLALSPGKDEESQYDAFVKDCLDHLKQKALINEHVTSIVNIKGEDHVVSVSGFLALMKAAGPQNAVHWIQNPDERSKFPNTTEVFLRTNNCF